MKFLRVPFLLCAFLLAVSCSSSSTDDAADPLADVYGRYITGCLNVGSGNVNQLYAVVSEENKTLSIALLTWSNADYTGTYAMTDFDGNTITQPVAQTTFKNYEVNEIPEGYFIFKMTEIGNGHINYTIFQQNGNHLNVMSDYPTPSKEWSSWLEKPQVAEFVAAPNTYAATGDYTSFHFTKTGKLPNALEPLFGHWISDCSDFGGGPRVQVYVEFNEDGAKSANLNWTVDGCSGSSTLTDSDGNPVTKATTSQTIKPLFVSGITDNYLVVKATQINDPSMSTHVVIYVGSHEFYELVPYNDNGPTWADWLMDGDVSDFDMNPATASPASHIKLHFTEGELP